MVKTKAALFDLHGSLAYVEDPIGEEEIPDYLVSKGYEVSRQTLNAAWSFVAFIDYPKYGYENWRSFFSKITQRLGVKVDKESVDEVVELLEKRYVYKLYPDVAEAVTKAKQSGLKTAIVTTIPFFQFEKAVEPVKKYIDFVMTGSEAGCDKSNPKMYRRVLQILEVSPKEAVMIGDNIEIDILLPRSLGINAILLDREGKKVKCEDAYAVANSLTEAVEIILRRRDAGNDFRK